MGWKEKMAENWMGNMDPKERREMAESMMDNFFSGIPPEEKATMIEAMMEKFMAGLNPEDKKAMMANMMPKMMSGMMGGKDSSPGGMMGMMMGKGGPMKEMMAKMMGPRGEDEKTGEGPWDMCRKMMAAIGKTSDLATFATPEVRNLFEEWAAQIEEEIFQFITESKTTDADQIAARFKLSNNGANYFLSRLSQQGKISLKAEKAADK